MDSLDKTLNYIKRRGFFLESCDGSIYMSDNAHADDATYLDTVLRKNNIGYVDTTVPSNEIIILHPENNAELAGLFSKTTRTSYEMCWSTSYDWRTFAKYEHGKKVPVSVLEPNIAYYCKALSACGLMTISSCDGNHDSGSSRLFVVFETRAYEFWHQFLWRYILSERFPLAWQNAYSYISLNCRNRQLVYDSLYRAADFLYINRFHFRQLKQQTTEIITKRFRRDNTDTQIMSILTDRALLLIDKTDWLPVE